MEDNQKYEYIDVSPEDLYITNLHEEFIQMRNQSFLPLIQGQDLNKHNVWIYQYDVYKNAILNIRCPLNKLVVKRDFFFSASSNLSTILQCKGNKELFEGFYEKTGTRFLVFARKIVKNEVDLFTERKERFKQIADSED